MSNIVPRKANQLVIKIADIDQSGRIREDYSMDDEFLSSIKTYGLIQPVVLNHEKKLIAGGRRIKAHLALGEDEVAYVVYETLDETQLRILETEENIQRKDFNWRERVLGVVTVHETAKRRAILEHGATAWTQQQTGSLLGIAVGNVNNYIKLATLIRAGDKDIVACEGIKDALNLLLLRKEREGQKILANFMASKAGTGIAITQQESQRILAQAQSAIKGTEDDGFFTSDVQLSGRSGTSGGAVVAPVVDEMPGLARSVAPITIPLSNMTFKADCLKLMQEMPPGCVDHIITDIPYGIEMGNLAQEQSSGAVKSDIASVSDTHSVYENVRDFKLFLANAFRLLPDSGYCIFWCDIDHWEKLRDIAYETGFKVQRWPLIWQKTHTCKNEAAQFNFTKNSEIAMVCRKGNATLIIPQQSSFWSGSNEAERAMLGHPFVKPFKLWEWVLQAVATRGQRILDPYAGVGSFGIAAVNAGFLPISIEMDEVHFNRLVVNVANAYKSLHPNVQFT